MQTATISATPTMQPLPASLGTLTTHTWTAYAGGPGSYGAWVASTEPAVSRAVLRTGLSNAQDAVRLLLEDQHRNPSVELGYVALVRHGATLEAVQLGTVPRPGMTGISAFEPAPGVQVDSIWRIFDGYSREEWSPLATTKFPAASAMS